MAADAQDGLVPSIVGGAGPEAALREHNRSFAQEGTQFKLSFTVVEAHDLIAMDKCGTSDPYCKVKVDSHTIHKTKIVKKSLDPVWNETFDLILDHLGQRVALSVYDYDRGAVFDDFLGKAQVDILTLQLGKVEEVKLELVDKVLAKDRKHKNRGFIVLKLLLEKISTDEAKVSWPYLYKKNSKNKRCQNVYDAFSE